MYILALAKKGAEFMYNSSTAHQVSKNSAEKIKNTLNQIRYKIKSDSQVWHIYEVDRYDASYNFAMLQRFTIRNGIIKEKFGG